MNDNFFVDSYLTIQCHDESCACFHDLAPTFDLEEYFGKDIQDVFVKCPVCGSIDVTVKYEIK